MTNPIYVYFNCKKCGSVWDHATKQFVVKHLKRHEIEELMKEETEQ